MQLYFYNGQSTTYSISKDGKVFNNKTNKFLKGQKNKNGYWSVQLSVPNDKKRLYIHRMIMETYCPNENSKNLEVNHIDGNKNNNILENLEWCTSQENKQHAKENYLNSSIPVYGFNEKKELVLEFRSMADVYRLTGWNPSGLSAACNMIKKIKYHDYYWSFSKENNFEIIELVESGKNKPVNQFDQNGNLIESYVSLAEAARKNNCSRPHIGEACNGKLKTYKGFIWKYQTNL